ncbi:YdaS family helix-turn-helix protein [Komagataeibacter sp. SM21]|uniref:YdaS family helix-turn-helix protein n=1 Tax=Komagataeibacter sp. SM21 TaxID=3242899 RepID=UPI00352916B6
METVSDLVRKNGGAQAVADLFGVTRPAVVKWCRKNQFPARLTVDIAHVFGVPETVLRPDIFRKPVVRPEGEGAR